MNGHFEAQVCDRCDAEMVSDGMTRGRRLSLDLFLTSTPDELDMEQRVLCGACETELLEWIDEGEVSREGKVDLPDSIAAGVSLRRTAEQLEALADEVGAALDPDTDEMESE